MAVTDLVGRINRLFNGLVGCELEFQAAESLRNEDWSVADLALMREPIVVQMPKYFASTSGATFGFPVNVEGSFAGLAIVHGWQESGDFVTDSAQTKKLLMLAELVTIMLEHGLRGEDRSERLRMIEERLRLIDTASNVIPLRPARYSRVLQVTEMDERPEPIELPITSLPLLVETKPGFPLHRIAVEIHQMSRRWAFLSTDDLPADIFDSRESVQELGGITLFIKDLTLLTTNQQIKLAEYLAIKPDGDMPQVIAGLTAPLAELLQAAKVLPHVAEFFCHTTLQWTGKSAEQVTGELVKASLEHILQQTRQAHVVEGEDEKFIPFNIQYFDPEQPLMH